MGAAVSMTASIPRVARRLASVLMLVGLLTACGTKGPLVMPRPDTPARPTTVNNPDVIQPAD
jgi:predicted small lipoprotein YifL